MTPREPPDRRRVLALLAWGAVLAAVPLSLGGPGLVAPPLAWADDDEDHSGSGGGGGRDDDGDNGGHGGGDDSGHGGGDDSDDDEDNSGSGGGDDDSSGRGGGRDGRDDSGNGSGPRGGSDEDSDRRPDNGSGGQVRDVTVQYPDGWIERIVGGRYELIDQQSRLVVSRRATAEDYARMIALR